MSREFQIAFPCSHLTVGERIALASDRRSLKLSQTIASQATFSIFANDEYIPSVGLYTPAQLYSKTSGPFDLTTDTKVFTVLTSSGSQTITLPIYTRTRLKTDQIIKEILKQTPSIFAVENVNGHLVFTDTQLVGPEAFVKITGDAAAPLGFGDSALDL